MTFALSNSFFFPLNNAIFLPEGCSSPRSWRYQNRRLCMFALRVSMQTSVPTARWFTWWYDSSHVCIPAASREAVHVHSNNEVLLKNRPASFIFSPFCLLDDFVGCCQHECLSLLLCKLFTPSLLPYMIVFFSEAVPCSFLRWLK